MSKTCTICKEIKSFDCFHKKTRSKDGYQNVCKHCSKLKSQDYYNNNTEKHKLVTKNKLKEERSKKSEFINKIKTYYGCQLCNERESCCLEFHHCVGEKEFNIADFRTMGVGFDKLKNEIAKCVILCSNCHKKVHAELLDLNNYNLVELQIDIK